MTNRQDEQYMRLALKEARKGLGRTSPNPCVGAVIVKHEKIISKGYHKKAGAAHAEIDAIQKAVEAVSGATIYVTLEPCNHTGKTPPCSHALAASGFTRVVVGMTDPNPLVNGSGIEYLKSQGIEVTAGVLRRECEELNFPFIKHITKGMPWTIMKAGLSLDGRLNYQKGQSGWITGDQSKLAVHKLRNRVDAILVGRNTVEIDNPSLTTRLPRGEMKDPIRVIVDSKLQTSLLANVYTLKSQSPTWVACAKDAAAAKKEQFRGRGIKLIEIDRNEKGLNLQHLLRELGREDICSVLVEGGAQLHGAFLRERLFDYAHLFYAPLFAGDQGVSLVSCFQALDRETAPKLAAMHLKRLGNDLLVSGRLQY